MNWLYNDKKIVRKFHLPLNYNAPPPPPSPITDKTRDKKNININTFNVQKAKINIYRWMNWVCICMLHARHLLNQEFSNHPGIRYTSCLYKSNWNWN